MNYITWNTEHASPQGLWSNLMLCEISFLRTHAIVPEGPIPHSNQTSNALISISSNVIIEPKMGMCYSE